MLLAYTLLERCKRSLKPRHYSVKTDFCARLVACESSVVYPNLIYKEIRKNPPAQVPWPRAFIRLTHLSVLPLLFLFYLCFAYRCRFLFVCFAFVLPTGV